LSTEAGKPAVLIVDDEPIIRMYATVLVEDAGYVAIEAATADEALAILSARDDIRVLFTDVEMPGSLNGLELVEVVRETWPPIELIVTSGHVQVDPQRLPERARFFRKPYTESEVIKALRALPLR
jgi:CheY-like chemotaxis protein